MQHHGSVINGDKECDRVRERYDHGAPPPAGRPVSDLSSSSILLRPQVCCVLFLGLFDAVTTFEEKETETHISIVCSFTHGRKCQG
jgi:hypothetical protein